MENEVITVPDNGQVYIFDMSSWSCVHSFFDEGCVQGTTIAFSPNGRFLACGSSSGIVNVYDASGVRATKAPTPIKAFGALRTEITTLAFNSTSEILAIASLHRDNAIKLVRQTFCFSRLFTQRVTLFDIIFAPKAWHNREQLTVHGTS